ncbi:hypothetical protein SBM3_00103 [Synechococcus phage S-BM3]|jgi:hypothetical protein|nr:hypothetical protein SBM3_00103 [Synechococcus phage S-BM3]|tara:strand:+ start:87 stop:251 length:165 start_codon:yes stop_codon:yes gene_type:complete
MKNKDRFDSISQRLDEIEGLIYELKGAMLVLQCRVDQYNESTDLRMSKHDDSSK